MTKFFLILFGLIESVAITHFIVDRNELIKAKFMVSLIHILYIGEEFEFICL